MCACLVVLLGVFAPRLAFVILWLFSGVISRAYDSFIIPLLGVIFLPYTALFYALAWTPEGISVFGWIIIGAGFILDLGAYGAGGWSGRRQYYR